MLRLFALSVTLFLVAQAVASGNRAMICRYSGKVMEDCPCPPAPEDAQLDRQSCCELRTSTPFTPVGLVRSVAAAPVALELAATPPVGHRLSLSSFEPPPLPVLSQAPPGERERFLRTRLLLI